MKATEAVVSAAVTSLIFLSDGSDANGVTTYKEHDDSIVASLWRWH